MDSKEEKLFICPVCGSYLSITSYGNILANEKSWSVEYTSVIHPQLGLKASIEAKTSTPRESSYIIEDPKHGKVSCIENKTHEIPRDLVKQISQKTREKRDRVPMKTISGGLAIFKNDEKIQESIFDDISDWYGKVYPTLP